MIAVVRSIFMECRSKQMFLVSKKASRVSPVIPFHKRNYSVEQFVQWQSSLYSSISNSYPVSCVQDGLLYFHDTSGLPWWVTILSSTILLRAALTLPLSIYQHYILAKVEIISLELKELIKDLEKETALATRIYKLNDKHAMILFKRSLKKQWQNLVVRDNCHPFKASLVIWIQIPIWICMSFSLRNLVYVQENNPAPLVTLMELSAGGCAWIPNLTQPDCSLILPIAFGLMNLAIIEVQKMSKLREPSKIHNVFTNVFRLFSIIMIPVAANVPSAICLYWTTSSAFGLIQNLTLVSPTVRRHLRIPLTPSELESPYIHMKTEFSHKLKRLIPSSMKKFN